MLKLIHALDIGYESVLDYCYEFNDNWNDLNCYAIQTSQLGEHIYYDYIETKDKNIYYLIDDTNPSYIIGFGSIEDSFILNYHKNHLNFGNVGYGVRPSQRNKNYGKILLSLLIEKCEEMGMKEICVSCLKNNIASKKIIEFNNGKLEKEFYDDWSNVKALKFWIKLHPKFKDRTKRLIRETKKYFN